MLEMTRDEIHRMLNEVPIGRLCMADLDGRPYTLPFPFCFANNALYLRVALTGRKGDILRANNRVCFEVDTFTPTLDDYASVLIEGTLVAVDDPDEKAEIRRINTDRYQRLRSGKRPGHGRQTPLDRLPLRKIVIDRITGRKRD